MRGCAARVQARGPASFKLLTRGSLGELSGKCGVTGRAGQRCSCELRSKEAKPRAEPHKAKLLLSFAIRSLRADGGGARGAGKKLSLGPLQDVQLASRAVWSQVMLWTNNPDVKSRLESLPHQSVLSTLLKGGGRRVIVWQKVAGRLAACPREETVLPNQAGGRA
ncbi:hypothetical protein VTI74DRAFT_7357 [Chaetomium olivicolor]